MQPEWPGQKQATVQFVYNATASRTLTVNDASISNCNILVYNTAGQRVAGSYNASGEVTGMSLETSRGELYKFYCVCNIGDITSDPRFATEMGLTGYQYTIADYSGIINGSGAVPMSGNTGYLLISDGMNIHIDLTRCVAMITIRLDSRLQNADIEFDSVTMKNVPARVGLFSDASPTSASDCLATGDAARGAELYSFNHGHPISFYMFENAQGDLLPANTSCRTKFFASGSLYSQICSYIELEGYYNDSNSGTPRYGPFTYRFYLGGNTTTDFSIVRNHHYDIVVELYDDGVDEPGWRVDDYLIPYATEVIVTPPSYTFYAPSGTVQLTATVLPADACQTVTWRSSNPSVASVDARGLVTAHSYGTATVTATATDGSGASDYSVISVIQPRTPVRIRPNYLPENKWLVITGSSVSDLEVTITYSDGSERVLTGAEALATVDTNEGWIVSGGRVAAPDFPSAGEMFWVLNYTENGHTVSFISTGEVITPEDIYTLTVVNKVAKKPNDSTDTPMVCHITILPYWQNWGNALDRVSMSCSSPYVEICSGGYRLKGNATINGYHSFTITGTFVDWFNNSFSYTRTISLYVYQWREHYYNVCIDTSVREHIDTSFGSQEQPDNIIVRAYLTDSYNGSQLVLEQHTPANYDQDGNLIQSGFSFTWYNQTLYVQMQDYREFTFDYDRSGNYLTHGYTTENGVYIYYEQ